MLSCTYPTSRTYLVLPTPMELVAHKRATKARWVRLSIEVVDSLLTGLAPSELHDSECMRANST